MPKDGCGFGLEAQELSGCFRAYDQTWLDYQKEIVRHMGEINMPNRTASSEFADAAPPPNRVFACRQVLSSLVTLACLLAAPQAATAGTRDVPSSNERKHIMTMKDDLANRSPEIHWPDGFSPSEADLFSHNEGFVDAPCERVWRHIIAAPKWPEWYPNSKGVQITGGAPTLSQKSVFTWTTFGLPLESRINEFVPFSRIGWYGYAPGETPSFYHTWFLTDTTGGCRVITDEVGRGASAKKLRETDEGLMHRGHDLWIATLKWVAEGK
jgi:uncharacterized protein YndB with AHSA1/START domain